MAVAAGIGIMGWIGVSVGPIVGGIIGGIVIGAAVGGLTAAITGGSIGKGMLYGAIGGAVTGGLQGAFTAVGTTGAMNVGSVGTDGLAQSGFGHGLESVAMEGTKEGIKESVKGSMMSKIGTEMVKGGVEGAFKLGEGVLGGIAQEKISKQELAEKQKDRDWQSKEAALNREHAMAMSKGGGGGGGAGAPDHFNEELAFRKEELYANLAQRKAEMNKPYEDAERGRKSAAGALANMRAIRRGKGPVAETKQEAVYNGPVQLEGGDTEVVQKKVDAPYELPEGA